MQAIIVQEGSAIDYTPGSDVAAGAVVVQNDVVGVARTPIAANTLGSLATAGIVEVVHDAVTKAAGTAVYWNATGNPVGGTPGSGAATLTAGGATFMGWAVQAAADTAKTVRVKLFGSPAITNNFYGPLNHLIADPGDAGAIPVTASGRVDLVTAGAETRTLAAPTIGGQMLLLGLKTDGGDCVITCATTVNQTGNNTITLGDEGDALLLVAKANGANLRWSVVANDGCTLATV